MKVESIGLSIDIGITGSVLVYTVQVSALQDGSETCYHV